MDAPSRPDRDAKPERRPSPTTGDGVRPSRPESKPEVERTPVGRPFTRPVSKPSLAAPTRTVKGGDLAPDVTDGPGSIGNGIDAPMRRAPETKGDDGPPLHRRERNPRFDKPSLAGDAIGKPVAADRIVGSKLSGVDLAPPSIADSNGYSETFGGSSGGSTVVNNTTINNSTVNYITNVNYANSSWCPPKGYGSPWCGPLYGPKSCWNSCDNDGFSIGIGFGSGGFSFGLFYSDWGSPLCSSWCDPWWDGWCSQVVVHCPPRYRWCRPCWSPCGTWYSNYVVYREVPASWCTPVYAWTPTVAVPSVTTINNYYDYDDGVPAVTSTVYTQPVTTAPTALPAGSAAEAEAWDLLSNGFPRSSAETFAQLHDANPNNTRALVGYGISLAMLEDIAGSASVLRQAIGTDPGLVASLPLSQQLVERIRLLESSAEVASRQSSMSRDGLLLLSTWRAMQGRFTEAHLAILSAQQAGEQSLAAARLRSWLEGRMIPPA